MDNDARLMLWLFQLVNRKHSPEEIPLSSGLENRDYFSLYLRGADGEDFLFRQLTDGRAEILVFDDSERRYVHPAILTVERAVGLSIQCKYYHGHYEYTFTSVREMHRFIATGRHMVSFWRLELMQWLANKRSLPSIQRHHMVRFIVEQWLKDRDFLLYPFTRLKAEPRRNLSRHPKWRIMLNREHALLESLVATKDLEREKDGLRYTVQPQIIHTLEQLDIDQQRHRSATRIQVFLIIVAFISAVAAGIQAFAAMNPPSARPALQGAPSVSPTGIE
ncbi:hypothetical protein [Luteibacter sp. 22Crub2.1]|uniref:hypothetical protein n=1 Tax=Luteibacter sp. 22Crub2.1 TaxID=1283288 RepID=UPI0009A64352|nr:hypothetical protein [Luteibacter sp. 22Crub2.1]SKB27923.1 hypothetical protein SAMN05660880_00308 [Luteibacter sp. 22Crub2.1]